MFLDRSSQTPVDLLTSLHMGALIIWGTTDYQHILRFQISDFQSYSIHFIKAHFMYIITPAGYLSVILIRPLGNSKSTSRKMFHNLWCLHDVNISCLQLMTGNCVIFLSDHCCFHIQLSDKSFFKIFQHKISPFRENHRLVGSRP